MHNKVILVTGASSGIGESIAQSLAVAGYKVYAASRKVTTGQVRKGFIELQMDVCDENSVYKAMDYIRQKDGQIFGLINSAGLGMTGSVEFTSDKEARALFDTNVFGVLNVCRAAIPLMRPQRDGYIINITSIAAQMGLPYRGIYSSSKFAVEGFTESLSMEVSRFGIKVCIIEPGDFRTGINNHRMRAAADDTVYYGTLHHDILEQVRHEVSDAPTPEVIGKRVIKILSDPKPRLRYRIASPKALLSYRLMRTLPSRWFEAIIRKYYKL